jgi:hypothetical protein
MSTNRIMPVEGQTPKDISGHALMSTACRAVQETGESQCLSPRQRKERPQKSLYQLAIAA